MQLPLQVIAQLIPICACSCSPLLLHSSEVELSTWPSVSWNDGCYSFLFRLCTQPANRLGLLTVSPISRSNICSREESPICDQKPESEFFCHFKGVFLSSSKSDSCTYATYSQYNVRICTVQYHVCIVRCSIMYVSWSVLYVMYLVYHSFIL